MMQSKYTLVDIAHRPLGRAGDGCKQTLLRLVCNILWAMRNASLEYFTFGWLNLMLDIQPNIVVKPIVKSCRWMFGPSVMWVMPFPLHLWCCIYHLWTMPWGHHRPLNRDTDDGLSDAKTADTRSCGCLTESMSNLMLYSFIDNWVTVTHSQCYSVSINYSTKKAYETVAAKLGCWTIKIILSKRYHVWHHHSAGCLKSFPKDGSWYLG